MKKLTAIVLTIFILFTIPTIAFATNSNTQETSLVTFKANMSDPKIAYYYPYVCLDIYCLDEGKNEKYTILIYDENDFTKQMSLPNGNYVILGGGIENDLNGSFVQSQNFTVGDTPNTLVEFTVYKDMSGFADIPETTAITEQTQTTTIMAQTETITKPSETTTPHSELTTSISTETTTSSQEPSDFSLNIGGIIISLVFAAGIIVLIVFLIKKYK